MVVGGVAYLYTISIRIRVATEFEVSQDFGHPQFPSPIFFKADLYYWSIFQ